MDREIELEGILVAMDWRADGSVAALGLNLADERELRIECGPRRYDRLTRYLRKRVRMSGFMDAEAGIFRPRRCRVLGTPGDPDRGPGAS